MMTLELCRCLRAGAAVLTAAGTMVVHAAEVTYKTVKDLPYSPEPGAERSAYQNERCKLDLHVPEGRKGFATVVWYHGGGLTGGSKHFPGLTGKGLGLVAVNYRLYPKVTCATAIGDAAAALAWTFKNIETYGGDPSLIFVSGSSAGGYLTSMLGFDKRWLAKHGIDANDIKGLIPYTGHTITHMTVRKERYGLSSRVPVIDEFAPIYHARADAAPVLLLTGDRKLEMLGRCEENELFCRILKNIGHPDARHLEFEGYGHDMGHPANPVALKWITRVLGCTPEALIVPLDHAWNFTRPDRKYGWSVSGADPGGEPRPCVECLPDHGREDSGALAVRDGSTVGNAYARSAYLPVRPGKRYILRGWAKNEGEGQGSAGICLNLASGRRITKQAERTSFDVAGEWTEFEIMLSPVPNGTDALVVYLLPRPPGQPSSTMGAVLYDDLRIREDAGSGQH